MIAVVKETATTDQLDHLVSWIEDRGFRTNVSQGDNETIIGIIGDTTRIDPFILESMDIVERVQRVSEPYKLANRKFHPEGHGRRLRARRARRRGQLPGHRRPVLRRG